MGEAPSSDAELVRRARQGDDRAFGDLVVRHQDYIYNAVFHLVSSEKDAEDLAQEVFVRAYEGLKSFEGRAKFTTWVYGIMLNTVRSFWRRRGRRDVVSLDLVRDDPDSPSPEPPAEGDGPVRMAMRQEQVSVVRAAISELEEDLREILVLRDIQGFTYDEMAETLDVPQGTVKSRLHRARQRLKDRLEDFFSDAR